MYSTADVPGEYVGAWRAVSTQGADTTSFAGGSAFWIQTSRLHGDISVPAGRPAFSGKSSLAEYSREELLSLAEQQGIAGSCIVEPGTLHRRRQMDYQPSLGRPFIRRMRPEGNLLFEDTVVGTDLVVWERMNDSPAEVIAFRFQDETDRSGLVEHRKGMLLAVGEYFMFVRDRSVFVPQSESLQALLECRDYSMEQLVEIFGFEVSFGVRSTGRVPWEIQLSTLPFREGQALLAPGEFESIAEYGGRLPQRIRRDGEVIMRRWALDEWKRY